MANTKDPHRYDDMLDMPHHISAKHPRMSPLSRAAQFAPFAALTGFDAQIKEAEFLNVQESERNTNEVYYD